MTGTVELPIEKIMNWVGGFTDPMAALDFMSSGGVPTTALTAAGKVEKARFEHVWVEAWIDYRPSRGAKHINGKGDTWIPLDPSYKQYNYTQGINIKKAVPFDAQGFLTQIQSTATVNEAAGYVTGVDSVLTQQTMQDYQTRVQNYIQQNYPNATVGDVLGKKEIVKKEYPYLLGTLPYKPAVKGGSFAVMPDSFRHKLSFNVTASGLDETPIALTMSLPELAGKKITLSYSPATAQDEAVINSYLPQPHADGTPIQPSELPQSLPAYLIKVKPELRIDGQVVATGSPVTLGSVENFVMNFSSPWIPSDLVNNTITAGTYQAIALDLGRISAEQVQEIKSRLESIKTRFETQNFGGLTKEDLVGDLLYTIALMYHAELGMVRHVSAQKCKVTYATWPSETIFKTDLAVSSFFGVPRNVSPCGLAMDADKLATVSTPLDGDQQKKIIFLVQTGMASSALEHSVPEQVLSTTEKRVEGVSAVKALSIANDQGIPVYTINQGNITNVMPQLQIDQQVKMDIQNAVNSGKIAIVSKTNITFNGWTGCGYIILDPLTGAGAYMIGGGLSGSTFWYTFWTVMWVLAWVALITAITVFVVVGATLLITSLPAIISAVIEGYYFVGAFATIAFKSMPRLAQILTESYVEFQDMSPPNSLLLSEFDFLIYFMIVRNNIILEFMKKLSFIYNVLYVYV